MFRPTEASPSALEHEEEEVVVDISLAPTTTTALPTPAATAPAYAAQDTNPQELESRSVASNYLQDVIIKLFNPRRVTPQLCFLTQLLHHILGRGVDTVSSIHWDV